MDGYKGRPKLKSEGGPPPMGTNKSDELSAQFGAEGLSLKVALPRWAKTVIAILLAVGFLESVVVVKAIEIHDRYEQSQVAHRRLVKELTEAIQKAEKEKQDAETQTQIAISERLSEAHFRDIPVRRVVVSLPNEQVVLMVFKNSDIAIVRTVNHGSSLSTWLPSPALQASK